jgi:tRNA synthetases class I (E and Q), catalytic domain
VACRPKWCIYPSYDFTHCIVDALENVTHSLCTLEFETRRASYYWLLHALGLYMPLVWEYSRLNVTHNVMSKRKLQARAPAGVVRVTFTPVDTLGIRPLQLAEHLRIRPAASEFACAVMPLWSFTRYM